MTESDVNTAVLHRKLAEHMDTETADALIERLPPDWEQLATKTDLAQLGTEMRGEMAEMRGEMAEMRGGMAEMRGEMAEMRGEFRGGMARLGTDVGGKLTTLAAAMEAMEGRLDRRAARDLRTVLFAFAGFALAVMGMFVTLLVSGVPAAG